MTVKSRHDPKLNQGPCRPPSQGPSLSKLTLKSKSTLKSRLNPKSKSTSKSTPTQSKIDCQVKADCQVNTNYQVKADLHVDIDVDSQIDVMSQVKPKQIKAQWKIQKEVKTNVWPHSPHFKGDSKGKRIIPTKENKSFLRRRITPKWKTLPQIKLSLSKRKALKTKTFSSKSEERRLKIPSEESKHTNMRSTSKINILSLDILF